MEVIKEGIKQLSIVLGSVMVIVWLAWSITATGIIVENHAQHRALISAIEKVCTTEQKTEIENLYFRADKRNKLFDTK